jgi:hypothetical protein
MPRRSCSLLPFIGVIPLLLKRDLSDSIVRDVTRILNYGEESVSLGFEEIAPASGSAASTSPTSRENGIRS